VPDPVEAVTVYVVPGPAETPVTDGEPDKPDVLRLKLPVATPLTDSENTTCQRTLEAFVGDGSRRVIDDTVGDKWSIT
jgi:hypothetical protein